MEGSTSLDKDVPEGGSEHSGGLPAPLIERDEECALAAEAVTSAKAGRGSVVMVDGPSGLGKSSLLRAVCRNGRESGMAVSEAAGRAREQEFGFGVVMQMFESRVAEADEEEHSVIFARAARLAEPLFEAGPRWALSEPSFSLLHGVYRLCANMAERRPLLLTVDDADLVDEASLRFLLYLSERVADLPVVVVITARSLSRGGVPPLLGEIARHPRTLRSTLRPLTDEGAARQIAGKWLPGADDEDCAAIEGACSGNPFLIDAVSRELSAAGVMPGRAAAQVVQLAPASVGDWALAQADVLHPGARTLLIALAVLGPDTELRHAMQVAELGEEDAIAAADALEDAALVRWADGLTIAHPVVAASIEARQRPGERAARHLRAARLLHDEDVSPELVAAHLMKAARTGSGWVVESLCAASSVALGRGVPADAVLLLRRALDEPPPKRQRAHVVLELGRAEAMAGEPEALARLRDASDHVAVAPERARRALETGRTLIGLGRPAEAIAVFDQGLDDTALDAEQGDRLRAAHATAVWLAQPNGRRPLAPDTCPAQGGSDGERAFLALHAMDRAMRGYPSQEVRHLAELALGRGALLREEGTDGITYFLAAGALAFAEDLQTAEAALTAGVEDSQSRGSVLGFATASHMRSVAILLRGRVMDAAADARAAIAVESHGWRLGLGGARIVLANCLVERGDLAGAAKHVAAAEALENPEDLTALTVLATRGRLRLLGGECELALGDFLACGELGERSGSSNPALSAWRSAAAQAHAGLGDVAEGVRLAEEELTLAERFGAPGAIGRTLRHLGIILGPEKGIDALAASVAQLESSQAALERAKALVEYGSALRRSGKRRDARKPLREGLDLAERCGASVLATRALQEVKVAGARPRRTALTGLDSLTTREQQVALLAAGGLSNREIAEQLVVTVKTIEYHLKQTFTKLGIDSRQKLMLALEDLDR